MTRTGQHPPRVQLRHPQISVVTHCPHIILSFISAPYLISVIRRV